MPYNKSMALLGHLSWQSILLILDSSQPSLTTPFVSRTDHKMRMFTVFSSTCYMQHSVCSPSPADINLVNSRGLAVKVSTSQAGGKRFNPLVNSVLVNLNEN